MVHDRAIVTMTDQYEVLHDLSIGAIFNDPEYLTLNMALTVQDRHTFRRTMDN